MRLATSTTSRRSFPKGKKKKEESRTPRMTSPKPPMCRKNAKSGRSRTCILHCAAASVTVLACSVLRVLFSFLGDARVALQSLNNGPNLSGCLQTDVEEACELRARHPATGGSPGRPFGCRWRRKRVPKWRRSGPLPGEQFGVSLSLFPEVLCGTARRRQGRAVVGRGEANP